MADGDFTHFNGVYKEMAELLGNAAALQIWNRYAGFRSSCTPKST